MTLPLSQVIALGFVTAVLVLVSHRAKRLNSVYSNPLLNTTYIIVPTALILIGYLNLASNPAESKATRTLETLLGIELVWVLLSSVKAYLLSRAEDENWQVRIPGLFLDLIRLALVLIASAIVVAVVWDQDVGKFFATLGVGSLVLGLALQDTLGNLFAGVSLLFERPFNVGDWIQVGDTIGEVVQTNWRAVRLRNRQNTLVVVPNSILGKERIQNFTYFNNVIGQLTTAAFSYDDPPNKVKRVLRQLLSETPGVLKDTPIRIRTKRYNDFSISYELRYNIADFAGALEIEEDIQTRIWYAAKRHALTIPYPIQNIYKTEVVPNPACDLPFDTQALLEEIPLLEVFSAEDRAQLARDAVVLEFGLNENVVKQGDSGDSLYIVIKGHASVRLRDSQGVDREVALIGPKDVFGEMSLLTGELRSASIVALDDMKLLVIYHETLRSCFERRPELAEKIAAIAARRAEHNKVHQAALQPEQLPLIEETQHDLLTRIRRFFSL